MLCGFVGNFDKNGINFFQIWEQISYYVVAILQRYTPRCGHSCKHKARKQTFEKKSQEDFFASLSQEMIIEDLRLTAQNWQK